MGSVFLPSHAMNIVVRKIRFRLLIAEDEFQFFNFRLTAEFTVHIPFVERRVITNALEILGRKYFG